MYSKDKRWRDCSPPQSKALGVPYRLTSYSWYCVLFHRHRSRSPFLRLFAGFAVVFVSFSEERAGSCTSQDMHEIHSDADNFLHKTWLCSFSYQDVSPLLENILRQQAGFSLSLYMLSSFTFWKRHHVAVNTLICFTCHAVFRIWSSCSFLQVIRTSEI